MLRSGRGYLSTTTLYNIYYINASSITAPNASMHGIEAHDVCRTLDPSVQSVTVRRWFTVIGAILIVGFTVAGLTSEYAMPDGALYPLKIRIVEPVRATFSLSPEARARSATKRAEARLREAEYLAATNRLHGQDAQELSDAFSAEIDRILRTIADLSEKKPGTALSLASDLSSMLIGHAVVLRSIRSDQVSGLSEHIAAKQRDVRNANNTAMRVILYDKKGVNMTAIARDAIRKSLTDIAEAKRQHAKSVRADPANSADPQLEAADDALAGAQAQAENGAYQDAFVLAQRGSELARQASILLWARRQLHLSAGPAYVPNDKKDEADSQNAGESD